MSVSLSSSLSLPSLCVYSSPLAEINNEINDNRPENCFGFCSATILLFRLFFFLFTRAFSFLLPGSTRGKRDLSDHPARNLLDIYCASLSFSLNFAESKGRIISSRYIPHDVCSISHLSLAYYCIGKLIGLLISECNILRCETQEKW